MKDSRHTFKLTEKQEKQLNEYLMKVAQEQGEILHGVKTKLFRWAFVEWMEKHGDQYDIDWTGETPGSRE